MFKRKQIDMVNGPLLKNMIIFAIPVTLASLIQIVFNALDLVFAGQFCGTEGLAAVGSTTALTSLITSLFLGLGVGVNVAMAHALGSKINEAVSRVVHTALPLALVGGFLLFVFGFFFSKPLLVAMDTNPDVLDTAAMYMKIYFIGCTPMLVYNFAAGIFRADGDSETPMKFIILAGIINLCLKPLFILVLKLDVMGIATSTALTHFVSAGLSIRILMKKTDACRFEIKKMRFYKKELLRLLALGIPAGVQSSMFSVSNVLIQSAVNNIGDEFGKAFVAGNAAANNVESALNAMVHSVYQASINFTGQNVGKGNTLRVKKIFKTSLVMVAVLGVSLCTLVYIFRYPLLSMYTSDADAIALGVKYRLIFVCVPYFLYGIQDTMAGSIRGMGASVSPTIISILGICVFRVAWQYTVYPLVGTVESLFIAYPISWILTGIANVICYIIIYNGFKKRMLKRIPI
ncbi:MAG: MATE family efflux transporter [Clostridia bacterium]|nr:MATE family efflux transporter [Clostridia bacterium]